jgi:hypothetical protein
VSVGGIVSCRIFVGVRDRGGSFAEASNVYVVVLWVSDVFLMRSHQTTKSSETFAYSFPYVTACTCPRDISHHMACTERTADLQDSIRC